MKASRVYGDGAMCPPFGDFAIDLTYKLICMNLSTDADAVIWPRNRALVVDWYKPDAKMQERG